VDQPRIGEMTLSMVDNVTLSPYEKAGQKWFGSRGLGWDSRKLICTFRSRGAENQIHCAGTDRPSNGAPRRQSAGAGSKFHGTLEHVANLISAPRERKVQISFFESPALATEPNHF